MGNSAALINGVFIKLLYFLEKPQHSVRSLFQIGLYIKKFELEEISSNIK